MPGIRDIRAGIFRSVGILVLTAGTALAQAVNFALPAQPLSDSLKAVAQQTGQNILFTPQAVAGLVAPELHGPMSGRDAVNALIKGTNLSADADGNGGLIVHVVGSARHDDRARAPNDRPAAPPGGGQPVTAPAAPPQSGPGQNAPAGVPARAVEPTATMVEQVIVSASRISIGGYQQPTPVTMISADQLRRDGYSDIGDAIRQLPAFGASSSPSNTVAANFIVSGTPGIDVLNLRNLGVLRTLVLFNGQRVVASALSGGVDLSTMPTSLVQRVDVVTGGASAAWGSDAVAGVVNVILNRRFDGLAANIEGGDTWKGDHRSWKGELSYGSDFDGERGHLIGSVTYLNSPDTLFVGQRAWYKTTKLVNNPAYALGNGQPRFIHADNVGLSQATQGGLITASPANAAGANADALRGIQFVGPNGTPAPFNFGNISGVYSNGGSAEGSEGDVDHLAIPFRAFTFFGYGHYKLTSAISASLELNYGKSFSENNSFVANKYGTVTIQRDNAYLDPAIGTRMDALGITSFSLGTSNLNNIGTNGAHLTNNSLSTEAQSLGVPVSTNRRQLFRGVFNLDGSLGENWSWNAYFEHGQSRVHTVVINNVYTPNYNLAVDAVRVTAANAGTSGLPVGAVVCRSSLTDPANGCQPLDLFGIGVASPNAIAYINGPARDGHDTQLAILTQDVVSASMQGVLPWSLGAGQISVAFGGEYRKEAGRVTVDPLAQARLFSVGNFSGFHGQYDVEEGFVEIDVPLLKDNVVQSLEFNSAGRVTDYSTSGLVETWKLGLTSQVDDDIRLRTTWSFDIRAPDLQELYGSGYSVLGSVTDPHTGANVQIYNLSSANPNLKPEQSTTASGGVVLTPHWAEGLTLSADWYSIHINKAIATLNTTFVVSRCAASVQLYCGQLVFAGPGGALSQINTQPINVNTQSVSGLDFQGDYRTAFLTGAIDLHLVANYIDQQSQTAPGSMVQYAGSVGPDASIRGVPKLKATLAATYIEGSWQGTVQGRLIGAVRLNTAWGPLDVDDNNVPPVAYLDLRGSYHWTENIQLYAAIDNVLDTPPPVVAATTNSSTPYDASVRDDIYDAIGRQYRVGVRFNF
ncbi:MAG: TonB-dependent receptor [Pseudomonadota bacterium]